MQVALSYAFNCSTFRWISCVVLQAKQATGSHCMTNLPCKQLAYVLDLLLAYIHTMYYKYVYNQTVYRLAVHSNTFICRLYLDPQKSQLRPNQLSPLSPRKPMSEGVLPSLSAFTMPIPLFMHFQCLIFKSTNL